jgi:hypothetical protein
MAPSVTAGQSPGGEAAWPLGTWYRVFATTNVRYGTSRLDSGHTHASPNVKRRPRRTSHTSHACLKAGQSVLNIQ